MLNHDTILDTMCQDFIANFLQLVSQTTAGQILCIHLAFYPMAVTTWMCLMAIKLQTSRVSAG